QPFLKWAGGKRQLLPIIKEFIPQEYNFFYEPCVGAGALLFYLQPSNCVINDINYELMNCYQVIKDNPQELIQLCQHHQANNSKTYFYEIRKQDRQASYQQMSCLEKAARTIYLNKTCFNGITRHNSRHEFNAPYGDYLRPSVVNPVVISAVSDYLNQNKCIILNEDFTGALDSVKEGDWIYIDPPYYPVSKTASFTNYSGSNFTAEDQIRLKTLCDSLSDRGAQVLISNSATPFIRELYTDPRYEIIEVAATRAINCDASKRGKIKEYLIYNSYKCC
ncbi:MAG: hypothetical protein RLZZ499_2621, partial [Cyanobacteriota bacterium]